MKPRVLTVTGCYAPETSGASLQARALMRTLADDVDFRVLTVSSDHTLPSHDVVDRVAVRRLAVRPGRWNLRASAALCGAFVRSLPLDVVHLHGWTRKCQLVTALATAARIPVILKQTSLGQDDTLALRSRARLERWALGRVTRFVGVGPGFQARHADAGADPRRFVLIPNGVDLQRFRPPEPAEQAHLRQSLGLPEDGAVILSVGFASRDKAWDVLAQAWERVADHRARPTLVLLGPRASAYAEIDSTIADAIERNARSSGLGARLRLVTRAADIERWYAAADVFALPSLREGLPNALLEAMATARACVASRLPGVTDALIEDGVSGLLVAPSSVEDLAAALTRLLDDPARATRLGSAARRVAERYPLSLTASRHLDLYRELMGR